MAFKIKISYQTGDSFSTEEREEFIEYEWENKNFAEASMRRIEEHYKWYENFENRYSLRKETIIKPNWVDDKNPWQIILISDEGKAFKYHSFWIGYFEHLYGVELVLAPLLKMSFH
jgi:hypothetical protein